MKNFLMALGLVVLLAVPASARDFTVLCQLNVNNETFNVEPRTVPVNVTEDIPALMDAFKVVQEKCAALSRGFALQGINISTSVRTFAPK